MNQNDLTHFTQFLQACCVLYGKSMNETLIELYWDALEAFTWVDVKAAFKAHINHPDSGQFMPKPSDVVRYIWGSSQTQALQAWSKVVDTLHWVGMYESVVFDDPLIHTVLSEMGGWIYLCQTTLTKDMPFRANEFEKRYTAYVLHPPPRYPKQLTGWLEQQNRFHGYPIKPPSLMGDRQKALAVLKNGDNQLLRVQRLASTLLSYPPSEGLADD